MGNTKNLGKKKNTTWLGFGTSLNAPLVIPLVKDLTLLKGIDRELFIFDGKDDSVDIDSTLQFNTDTDFSITSIVINEGVSATKAQPIVSFRYASLRGIGLYFDSGEKLNFIIRNGATVAIITSAQSYLNEEINIKAEYTNSTNTMELFVNDVSVGTETGAQFSDSLIDTTIGGNIIIAGNAEYYKGTIEPLKVYSDITQTTLITSYDLTSSTLGSDNVKDLSGNGNHGTSFGKGEFTRTTPKTGVDYLGKVVEVGVDIPVFEGARFINDSKGSSDRIPENAIEFDGNNDRCEFENQMLNGLTSFTIGCWVNSPNWGSGNKVIYQERETFTKSVSFMYKSASTELYLAVGNGTTVTEVKKTKTLNNNQNYFYLCTFDSGNVKIYLDGVLEEEQTIIETQVDTGTGTYINLASFTNSDFLNGKLDNTIIWNTGLTGQQVMQQYLFNQKGATDVVAPENVVMHLPLSDNSSTQTDISGNGNDGTFNSGGSPAIPTLVPGVFDSDQRIDNDTLKGISVFQQNTNLALHSEDFADVVWEVGDSGVATANQTIAPDGTLTADLIDLSADTESRIFQRVDATSSGTHTFPIFLKSFTGSGDWPLRFRNSTQATNIDVLVNITDTEWRRFDIQLPGVVATDSLIFYPGNRQVSGEDLDKAYAWGGQLNASSFPFPYAKTAGSSVTVTKDVPFYDVEAQLEQGQGSIYAEFEILGTNTGAFPYIFSLDDGTTNNEIVIITNQSNNYIRLATKDGGVSQFNIQSSNNLVTFNTKHKVLISYKTNEAKLYFDGVKIGEDLSGTIPILGKLNIGSNFNNSVQLNGFIKNVKYHKEVLSESTALRLTTL